MVKNKNQMLLCLSSSLLPRYRHDILRAIAAPPGAYLQFRYSEDIVDSSLLGSLELNKLVGIQILIAYVDCSRQEGKAAVVPCRVGELVKSHRVASFFILQFHLTDFLFAPQLEEFNENLGENTPHWITDEGLNMWTIDGKDYNTKEAVIYWVDNIHQPHVARLKEQRNEVN